MADNSDTIDKVEKYVAGTIEKSLNAAFGLGAELSPDWLPDDYTVTGGRIDLTPATPAVDYDLTSLLVGKVDSGATAAERLYNTYTETSPDSELPGWLSVADPYFEERGIDPPETAIMGYTIDKTVDLKALWPEDSEELANTTIVVYKDDVAVSASKLIIDTEGLWWVSDTYDDLPLDIYVGESPVYTIGLTRIASESDSLSDLGDGLDQIEEDLESPVTEAGGGASEGGLDLSTLNYGADECHYIPRTLSFFSGQEAQATLAPYDVNGDEITLPTDQTYTVSLVVQDSRDINQLTDMFSAVRVGTTNEFTVDFKMDEPGMYLANLMIHKPSGDETPDTLLHVTRYYVSVAPSGNYKGVVTIPEIRYHLSDTCAQQNELLDAFEYSDGDIINAIHNCIEYFNGCLGGRGASYTQKTFPPEGRYFLKQGVCAFLLRSRAVILARNTLPYNAGGVSIDDQNKSKIYLEMASMFNQDWVQWCGRKQHEITFKRGFMRLS